MQLLQSLQICLLNYPISDQFDKAYATETVDSGSIPGWIKPTTIKNWYSQLPSLMFVQNEKVGVKPPPCVLDRWAHCMLKNKMSISRYNHVLCSGFRGFSALFKVSNILSQ